MFWGAGSWCLSVKDIEKLHSLQNRMSRLVLRFRRLPSEVDIWDYYVRVAALTKVLNSHFGIPKFEERALELYYSWAGHVRRMSPRSWAVVTTVGYNDTYRLSLRAVHPDGKLGTGAGRFYPWRWDSRLERQFNALSGGWWSHLEGHSKESVKENALAFARRSLGDITV